MFVMLVTQQSAYLYYNHQRNKLEYLRDNLQESKQLYAIVYTDTGKPLPFTSSSIKNNLLVYLMVS